MSKITILISFSGQGGVERMMLNLIRELSAQTERLDLLLIRDRGELLDEFLRDKPANVNLLKLRANHTLTAIPEIVGYFRKQKPESMLVAKDRAGRAALLARKLAGVKSRIVIRLGTNLSTALKSKAGWQRWLRLMPMRLLYSKADKVVAVSEGVRQDTLKITGIAEDRVVVIRNPVVTSDFFAKAEQLAEHKWFDQEKGQRSVPVIIGAGRLSYQKDFETLLRAVAQVHQKQEVRLIILGEGKDRVVLTELAEELGISGCVEMPGFQQNPYGWLVQADVFVLSSRWEGSPNVLTESLALGVPSVATRCPSGPDEVLADGRYGPLVDVEDVGALAVGILEALNQPLSSTELQQAVVEYNAEYSAQCYLEQLKAV